MSRNRTITLTLAEIGTLYSLVQERIEDGSYCGNRAQYYARLDSLLAKLDLATDKDGER